jgi:hypothetical protein
MKFLRKINKGFILTILVLIALIIYLVQLEIQRNEEKPEIEKVCKEYIELVNKYSNSQDVDISTEEKEKEYISKIREEIKPYLIDNEYVLDSQSENLLYNLENAVSQKVKTKVRKIEKIKKYVFDGNEVTVTLNSSIEIEKYEDNEDEKEVINKKTYDAEDTITLTKVDDTWKITYAELQDSDEYQYYNDMSIEDF